MYIFKRLYGRQARRKPRLLFLLSGLLLFRLPTVQLFALLFQLPPRLTRSVPDAPPYKVHTVFYSKIFEPLKRLTQCRFILFSKIHCTTKHILPVRFHCFGRLTLRPQLLNLSGKMCELRADKPGGSQDCPYCCQDCCSPVGLQCSCPRRCPNCRREKCGKHPTRPLEDR